MIGRIALAAIAIAALGANASPAQAQVAGEEAVILSGTSAGTGRASSGLGNAVRGSINGAARTIQTIPRSAPRGATRRSRGGAVVVDGPLAADSDPLENTDAPAYELSNGATIRVSGRLRNSASARCKLNCPGDELATSEEAQLEAVGPEEELPTEEQAKAGETARPEAEAAEPD
ncbi:MAG: hypothetical protein O2879_04060 [Proteobacteria bacterium]|nr:hypothetical protein [Pseudomonadota bacterium]MDA0914302.1 hypothetical protein [Pseudomonadota bacterium]